MAPTHYPHGLLQVGGFWAAIFAIPLCVSLFWYLLSHWGWWKLHQRGVRRPLVRTWHGWVESGQKKEKRERNRLRKPPSRILPRTTRADYSWVFWDPTGEKQRKFTQEREETILRYVPRWMRSSPFGSATPAANNSREIEARRGSEAVESDRTSTTGYLATLSLLGRGWRRGWRKTKTWSDTSRTHEDSCDRRSDQPSTCASTADQQTLDGSASTVRMRKTSQRRSTWEADSQDVERATNTQLLAPTAGFSLAHLFRRSSTPKPDSSNRPDVSPSSLERGEAGVIMSHHHAICPWHDSRNNGTRCITAVGASVPLRSSKTEERRQVLGEKSWQERVSYPARRVQTWAYGIDKAHPWSSSASLVDTDGDSVKRGSDVAPTIKVSKTRKEARSSDNTTAAAESMSMIDVPQTTHGGASEDEDGLVRYEGDDGSDIESFSSF
ncbi:MAG: hypothetical protein Q9225_007248 [Loekoesia sp. 1 TL-2023]